MSLFRRPLSILALGTFTLAGCAPDPGVDDPAYEDGADGKADGIGGEEDPSIIVARASRRLSSNLPASDVGKTFMVDDEHMPYADTFWPYSDPNSAEGTGRLDNGIDATFDGPDSPLTKYMKLADAAKLGEAKAWEKTNHGSGVSGVASWFGHCPGWTAAALLNRLPSGPISAKLSGATPVACTAGSAGCVTFKVADLTALLAEVYLDAPSAFLGARCDTAPGDIKRDEAGRILNPGCEGTNPATVMVVANAMIKKQHRGFAIDAQRRDKTDQIWNQPAFAYTVSKAEVLTEAQAAQLVLKKDDYASINGKARGWVRVTMSVDWATEPTNGHPEQKPAPESSDTHRFEMVLELDRPVTDLAKPGTANLIGGEYLDDDAAGANRLDVFPFMWTPRGPGHDDASGSADGHNPYVKTALVQQLVALAK